MVSGEDRPLIEEHAISERRGFLGGKRLGTDSEGKFQKTTFSVVCCNCGKYPLESFRMCRKCQGALCDECVTQWDGRPYCLSHLLEIIPISAKTFKVMLCIQAGIRSAGRISDVTRIAKDEINASLALLRELKLVKSSGMLAFLERKVTADGMRALSAYRKVYGKDDDVLEVENELAEESEDGP
jgi:hypothetical protein